MTSRYSRWTIKIRVENVCVVYWRPVDSIERSRKFIFRSWTSTLNTINKASFSEVYDCPVNFSFFHSACDEPTRIFKACHSVDLLHTILIRMKPHFDELCEWPMKVGDYWPFKSRLLFVQSLTLVWSQSEKLVFSWSGRNISGESWSGIWRRAYNELKDLMTLSNILSRHHNVFQRMSSCGFYLRRTTCTPRLCSSWWFILARSTELASRCRCNVLSRGTREPCAPCSVNVIDIDEMKSVKMRCH